MHLNFELSSAASQYPLLHQAKNNDNSSILCALRILKYINRGATNKNFQSSGNKDDVVVAN